MSAYQTKVTGTYWELAINATVSFCKGDTRFGTQMLGMNMLTSLKNRIALILRPVDDALANFVWIVMMVKLLGTRYAGTVLAKPKV